MAADDRLRFPAPVRRPARPRVSTRLVEPYRHCPRAGPWYLVAFGADRDDWRLFRLEPITDISPAAGAYRPTASPMSPSNTG
ncbi:WYL domain-containing protein [Streptomyces sp. NBC_01431]